MMAGIVPEGKEDKGFRGLRWYPPVLESEVLVLFGMLLPYLDDQFIVEEFNSSPAFPDCFATRNGKRVGIEFEVESKKFFAHKHHINPNLPNCDMIICWKNDFEHIINVKDKRGVGRPIEILELSKVVEEKKLKIFSEPRTPAPKWDEERFLEELKKKVGEGNTYDWVKDLIQVCKGYNEFVMAYGKGKRQATLGFHVRKWLTEGVGAPTPIQFSDDGSITFDYTNMLPAVEKELRSKTGHVKGRWRTTSIRDQKTFNTLKETIQWLAETISAKTRTPT